MGIKTDRLQILGDRIRALRKERKLTQAQLAYSINKDQQAIQRLESGKINPTFEFLFQVSEGLEMTLSDLLDVPLS